jgi:hypothetical protein
MFSSTVHHLLPQEKGQPRQLPLRNGTGSGESGEGIAQVGLAEPLDVHVLQLKLLSGQPERVLVGNGQHHQRAASDARVPCRVLDRGVR